ncbi:MAG: hypothetical protein ABL908_10210 [Hyphomicrobium sp.]
MAREGDEHLTEMPEKLFRQSADYAEVQEIGRQARQERADLDALKAAAQFGLVAGEAGSPLAAILAVWGSPRRVLVAAAFLGWAVVIVVLLMKGGFV